MNTNLKTPAPAVVCDAIVLLREENRELRIMCAIAHCGLALYHDDGELQDSREHPWIDWKRDTVKEIESKLHERFARRMKAETEKRSLPNNPVSHGLSAAKAVVL